MKVEMHKLPEVNEFKPRTFTITVETRAELATLALMCNVRPVDLRTAHGISPFRDVPMPVLTKVVNTLKGYVNEWAKRELL